MIASKSSAAGKGLKTRMRYEPDLLAFCAHHVDCAHGGLGDAAYRDDNGIGVFSLIAFDQLVLTPELLGEIVEDFLDHGLCRLERLILGLAGLGVNVRHAHGAKSYRIGGVEAIVSA